MRHAVHTWANVAVVFLLLCATVDAEESRSRWWPFGAKSTETAAPEVSALAAGTGLPTSGTAATAVPGPSPSVPSMTASPPLGATAPEVLPDEQSWMIQSPFARVSWPHIHLPEIHLPRPRLWPQKSEVDDVRNSWVGDENEPSRPSPLQAAKQGAQRVADSTRSAWRKTVDVFTPGDPDLERDSIAQQESRPSLWRRMFAAEEPQPEGPRTVNEFLAQERLDP